MRRKLEQFTLLPEGVVFSYFVILSPIFDQEPFDTDWRDGIGRPKNFKLKH